MHGLLKMTFRTSLRREKKRQILIFHLYEKPQLFLIRKDWITVLDSAAEDDENFNFQAH